MVPACQLCSGQGSEKEQWPLSALLSWRKVPLQPSSWSQTIQFLPICTWYFLSCCPSTRAQSQWVQISLCVGPLRETPGILGASISQSLLVSTARSYGDFFSLFWNPGLGASNVGLGLLAPEGGPMHLRYPSQFLATTLGGGTSQFHVSAPPTDLLCILSLKISVPLDFRHFWMTVL